MGKKSYRGDNSRFNHKKLDAMVIKFLEDNSVNELCLKLETSISGLRGYRKGLTEPPFTFVVILAGLTNTKVKNWIQ